MALNVNIIGRDSEGNLRALKVNSEGNLEISDSLGWGELLQNISDKTSILVDNSGKLDILVANSGKLDILTNIFDNINTLVSNSDKLDILTDVSDKLDILVDKDVVIGLLADRPPASEMRGKGYYAWDETDGHKLKYSDGTNWVVNQ